MIAKPVAALLLVLTLGVMGLTARTAGRTFTAHRWDLFSVNVACLVAQACVAGLQVFLLLRVRS